MGLVTYPMVAASGGTADVAPRTVLVYDATTGYLTSSTIRSADNNTQLSRAVFTYDGSGNLTQVVTTFASGVVRTRVMTYDTAGNVTLVTETDS